MLEAIVELITFIFELIFHAICLTVNAIAYVVSWLVTGGSRGEDRRRVAIAVRVGLFLTILAVAAGGYAIWGWRSAGRERRIAATESQVRAIAAKLAADTDEHGRLVPAAPEEADAWDQLIDIQYKSTIALDVVTATSLGPDRKPGTHDDITATRTVVPPKREIAREAVERVKDGAVNRLKRAISDRVRDESE